MVGSEQGQRSATNAVRKGEPLLASTNPGATVMMLISLFPLSHFGQLQDILCISYLMHGTLSGLTHGYDDGRFEKGQAFIVRLSSVTMR